MTEGMNKSIEDMCKFEISRDVSKGNDDEKLRDTEITIELCATTTLDWVMRGDGGCGVPDVGPVACSFDR